MTPAQQQALYRGHTVTDDHTFQLKNVQQRQRQHARATAHTRLGSDMIRKCVVATVGVNGCEVQVTSIGHGFVDGRPCGHQRRRGHDADQHGTNCRPGRVVRSGGELRSCSRDDALGNEPGLLAPTPPADRPIARFRAVQSFASRTRNDDTKVFPISTCVSERTDECLYRRRSEHDLVGQGLSAASPMARPPIPA